MSGVAKIGPWGGDGGSDYDITNTPQRLLNITIRSDAAIDSIAFSYIDKDGNIQNAGTWGGTGGTETKILLGALEFVKEISGTFGAFSDVANMITSLTIVTSVKTYGPFGQETGTPFRVPVKNHGRIVGFFARAGKFVDALGVYVRPA